MATPVLATKLFLPPPRPNALGRPGLLARLDAGLHRKLTLVAAPAGFGKTTLVSAWVAGCGRPAAWLSLDGADGDLARFLAHLIAALQTAAPALGAAARAQLEAQQPPSPEAVLTALLNEIAAAPRPALLVLDDYHAAATAELDRALSFLVDQLPPQLHLVLISRDEPALPLARLRARDQLNELRPADLRFTPPEAAAFLHEVMGLTLAADEVALLAARTEGWAAGLQLAALSLRDQPDAPAIIRSFAGSHRFVLAYLVEEVLGRQPAPIQRFLLHTAILDRLCGPLCDALLGDAEAPGQATLAALERANLFLFPLDRDGHWYRYHQLFAEALRQRLAASPAEGAPGVAELHRRASAWYEGQGLELEAFQHAAAAGDGARVARLAERSWQGMDRSFQSAAWLARVRQLPDAAIRARPLLSTQYAWALMDNGDLAGSEERLRDAERWLAARAGGEGGPPGEPIVVEEEQLRALPAMIAFARAYSAQARGDMAATAHYARLASAQAPDSHALLRAQAAVLLGLSSWAGGDLKTAYDAFSDWTQRMRAAGNLAFALVGVFGLIEVRATQGRLGDAIGEYRRALALASEQSLVTAYLDISYAMLQLEQGDRAAAARTLAQSEQHGAATPLVDWRYRWLRAQAQLQEAEGAWEAALALLAEAGRAYAPNPVPDLRPVAAAEARVQLRLGRLERALAWARERGLDGAGEPSYLREDEHLTLARVWLAEHARTGAARPLGDARALLARLLAAAEDGGRLGSAIAILVLQALAGAAAGDDAAALAALARALELGEPEGYVQVFVGEGPPMARLLAGARASAASPAYALRLLSHFPPALPAVPAEPEDPSLAMAEPLSEREREVLELIAAGLSNQAIAERLYLSLHTVKVHARNIYAKLGVASRTQAAARGRALGIVGHPPAGH